MIGCVGIILPKSSIAYIDVSFFVHATEDLEKVTRAVQNAVSTDFAEKITFKKSKLKGDRGNPIIFFKTRIEMEEIAEPLLEYISSRLSALDKEKLLRELSLHLEKGSLYMRLDKQAAFKGDLRLYAGDPIHLRIRFRKRREEEIVKICRELGLLP